MIEGVPTERGIDIAACRALVREVNKRREHGCSESLLTRERVRYVLRDMLALTRCVPDELKGGVGYINYLDDMASSLLDGNVPEKLPGSYFCSFGYGGQVEESERH